VKLADAGQVQRLNTFGKFQPASTENHVKEAVIVSTARTALAKSWKGALNMTHGATMGGHVVAHAVERAGIEPAKSKMY
jgi:hypothetical protein